jgi:4-alpha-glucanotransferase
MGDLGAGAYRFVDWLFEAGIGLWQVLPLVPPGAGNSPYSTFAALAGNPWLLDLEALVRDGLLDRADGSAPGFDPDHVDYLAVCDFKTPRLEKAADRLIAGAAPALREPFERFRKEAQWAVEAGRFAVLRSLERQRPWWQWPAPLRDRDPAALRSAWQELRAELEREIALQFLFERQWRALRDHCRARGVRLLGDVPIYVDRDSADVWAHREQFQLAPDGRPTVQAGVPPDYFSETGQLWGNPIYDWARMAADGFSWWIQRLGRALEQVDLVRVDHFRGISAYWEVPGDAEDAREGRWVDGPGKPLLDALRQALGGLPLVAEDLGDIDEAVHELRDAAGLPGMKVLQFAFGQRADHPFLPHNYEPHCVVYPGTHDNDTALGWWRSVPEPVRDHVRRYLARDGSDVVWDLIRLSLSSVADTAVIPMQDLLVLDSGARMNRPGLGEGNWTWRVRREAFNSELAARLREPVSLYGRLPRRRTGAGG